MEGGLGAFGGACAGVVEVDGDLVFEEVVVEVAEEVLDVGRLGGADGVAEVDVEGGAFGWGVEEVQKEVRDVADSGGGDGSLEGAGDGAGDVGADGHVFGDGAWEEGAKAIDGFGDGGVGVFSGEGFGSGGEECDFEREA